MDLDQAIANAEQTTRQWLATVDACLAGKAAYRDVEQAALEADAADDALRAAQAGQDTRHFATGEHK